MRVKLGEITKIKTGKLDANAASENGQYPFFTCSKETLKIDTYSYDCECVLVAGNGDLNVKYYNGKFDAYQRTYIIEGKDPNQLYMPYLYYFLDGYVEVLRKESIGGVIKYIKLGNLTEAEIKLPDVTYQKEIVNILDKVKQIIEDKMLQLLQLDELIKTRFVELFGDPVADSMRWGQVPLSHYLKSIRYGTSTPPSFSEIGYEFIRATNIKNGKIVSADMKYISEEEAQKIEKCKVLGGEMIIVRSGVNAGDTCIITDEHRGQYAGYDMILVFTEELHPVFVNVLINTEYMDRVVKPLTRRAAQPHLNSEQVQSFPIIQVPYEQQKEFALFVEQVDKSKFTIQKSLDEMQVLYDKLMQEYFG